MFQQILNNEEKGSIAYKIIDEKKQLREKKREKQKN